LQNPDIIRFYGSIFLSISLRMKHIVRLSAMKRSGVKSKLSVYKVLQSLLYQILTNTQFVLIENEGFITPKGVKHE